MLRVAKWFVLICCLLVPSMRSSAQESQKQNGKAPSAYAPRPEDSRLARGRATVERTAIANGVLTMVGSLPTPCHEIRVTVPPRPDTSGTAAIEVYSVFESGKMCAQMLQPFSIQVPLTPQIARAKITVNGKPAGLPAE